MITKEINLKEISEIELKALIYDLLLERDRVNKGITMIETELNFRKENPKVEKEGEPLKEGE